MRRLILVAAAASALVAVGVGGAQPAFPEVIAPPNGFQPEGIATGRGTPFYVGSIPTGAVYGGDLRTGKGAILGPGGGGRAAIGMDVERVPIAPNRRLGSPAQAVTLSGDFRPVGGFNLNGIEATANGKRLIAVQSSTGKLFTVEPGTGATREIDLGGGDVADGDGLLLDGRLLCVVQNRLNQIAVVRLAPDLSSGTIVRLLRDSRLDVPTTVARHGKRLYAVNARFGTPPAPSTEYQVVQVRP